MNQNAITTMPELDRLPLRSVILDTSSGYHRRWFKTDRTTWTAGRISIPSTMFASAVGSGDVTIGEEFKAGDTLYANQDSQYLYVMDVHHGGGGVTYDWCATDASGRFISYGVADPVIQGQGNSGISPLGSMASAMFDQVITQYRKWRALQADLHSYIHEPEGRDLESIIVAAGMDPLGVEREVVVQIKGITNREVKAKLLARVFRQEGATIEEDTIVTVPWVMTTTVLATAPACACWAVTPEDVANTINFTFEDMEYTLSCTHEECVNTARREVEEITEIPQPTSSELLQQARALESNNDTEEEEL